MAPTSAVAPPVTDVSALSFEDGLARLEKIVHALETGAVSLEQSIALYAEGVALKTHCAAKLADAQTHIEKIQLNAEGSPTGVVPLDPPTS